MKRPLARYLLNAFLVWHVSVLVLNNLPWSPLVAALFPKYSWYIRFGGLDQEWSMYQFPDHFRSEIGLAATLPDGSEDNPWGSGRVMSPRRLYVLEGLFFRKEMEPAAKRFLAYVHSRYPVNARPKELRMWLDTIDSSRFGERQLATAATPYRREYKATW